MRRSAVVLGYAGLIVLSALYCLPLHPSARALALLDVLVHAALFAGIGVWFDRYVGRSGRTFIPLMALAALLEVAQWWICGYARIEWPDILANEAGLVLALLWSWRRPASGVSP